MAGNRMAMVIDLRGDMYEHYKARLDGAGLEEGTDYFCFKKRGSQILSGNGERVILNGLERAKGVFSLLMGKGYIGLVSVDEGTPGLSGLDLLAMAKKKKLRRVYMTLEDKGSGSRAVVERRGLADCVVDWKNFHKYGKVVKELLVNG